MSTTVLLAGAHVYLYRDPPQAGGPQFPRECPQRDEVAVPFDIPILHLARASVGADVVPPTVVHSRIVQRRSHLQEAWYPQIGPRAVAVDSTHRANASAAGTHDAARAAGHRRYLVSDRDCRGAGRLSRPLQLLACSIEFEDTVSSELRVFTSRRTLEG
jgi:hypothetical protein